MKHFGYIEVDGVTYEITQVTTDTLISYNVCNTVTGNIQPTKVSITPETLQSLVQLHGNIAATREIRRIVKDEIKRELEQ